VTDPHDGDDKDDILDRVHDAVVAAANAVLVSARQLPATGRARIVGKGEDRGNDALPILLQADGLESPFRAGGLIRTSYLASPPELLDHVLERKVGLGSPLVERAEILGVF